MPTDLVQQSLKRSLDLREANHRVLSGNIANASTPGYRARRVDFAAAMRDAGAPLALDTTSSAHLGGLGGATAVPVEILPGGVEVDQQMAELADNQLAFEEATEMLRRRLALEKYVLQDLR